MNNSDLKRYIDNAIALVDSMVIKHAVAANKQNQFLSQTQKVSVDPRDWKYYKNLYGEYHNVDTLMRVVSLDDQSTIPFTKEALATHKATRLAYHSRGSYYQELVRRYPKQIQLMDGILDPIEKAYAIEAPDHTILFYNKDLVEPHEDNLIYELQQWINAWFMKPSKPRYSDTQMLYDATIISYFYQSMVAEVLNIRDRNIDTAAVHTFNMWGYLCSKKVDYRYQNYLTTAQTYWLYRNIDWLNGYVGTQKAQRALIDNLLTPNGYIVSSMSLEHRIDNMPGNLRPDVVFVAEHINPQGPALDKELYSVENVTFRQSELARGNEANMSSSIHTTTSSMERSLVSRLDTKVLESRMLSNGRVSPMTEAGIALTEWAYLSIHNIYRTKLTFSNPVTTSEFTISALDGVYLTTYLYLRLGGALEDIIPTLYMDNILRPQAPTVAQARKVMMPAFVQANVIGHYYDQYPALLASVNPATFALYSREVFEFNEYCALQRELVEGLTLKYNIDAWMSLAWFTQSSSRINGRWDEWLALTGIDLTDMDELALTRLAEDVFTGFTGISPNADSEGEARIATHQAMIELFLRLSSYSIQVLEDSSAGAALPMKGMTSRLDLIGGSDKASFKLPLPAPAILGGGTSANCHYLILDNDLHSQPIMISEIATDMQLGGLLDSGVDIIPPALYSNEHNTIHTGIVYAAGTRILNATLEGY